MRGGAGEDEWQHRAWEGEREREKEREESKRTSDS